MATITLELPESLKSQIDERAIQLQFPSTSAYLQSLIVRDLRRAEIDGLLDEAEAELERGEHTACKKGDTWKQLDEILARRDRSDKQ